MATTSAVSRGIAAVVVEKLGTLGRVEKMGRVGKLGKVRKLGRVRTLGRVRKLGRVGEVGELVEVSKQGNEPTVEAKSGITKALFGSAEQTSYKVDPSYVIDEFKVPSIHAAEF